MRVYGHMTSGKVTRALQVDEEIEVNNKLLQNERWLSSDLCLLTHADVMYLALNSCINCNCLVLLPIKHDVNPNADRENLLKSLGMLLVKMLEYCKPLTQSTSEMQ